MSLAHQNIVSVFEMVGSVLALTGETLVWMIRPPYRFGQLLARNVMNRRGVLKNELRHDAFYTALRSSADFASRVGGALIFAVGSSVFRLALRGKTRGPATKTRARAVVPNTSA